MAVFKLGAFITDIVGSIGGTTFKRGPGSQIIMNKNFGASYNKLIQNKQLNPIATIWKNWNLLSSSLRSLWDDEALNFEFPDKFGTMKNLTGRQLFSKLNIQLLPVGLYNDDPTGITSVINLGTISNFFIDPINSTARFDLDNLGSPINYTVQCEVTLGFLRSPTFTRRKVIYYDSANLAGTIDLDFQFFENFPYYSTLYNARLYVTFFNDWGFKSAPIYLNGVNI